MENSISNHNPEQTDAQKVALKFCMEKINNRLISLGLDPREYNTDLVQYDNEPNVIGTNIHWTDTDKTRIWIGDEANMRVILHELTHATASERRYRTLDELREGVIKSGFHRGVTFKVLNEAITEKIARELFHESYKENKNQIQPLFIGRSKEVIKIIEERYNQVMGKLYIDQLNNYKAQVQEERWQYKSRIAFIKNEDGIDRKKKSKAIKFEKKWYLTSQGNNYKRSHPDENLQKNAREISLPPIGLQKELLNDAYSVKIESDSYNEYVELLEVLLECIGLSESSDIQEFPERQRYEWDLLQKSYFTGNSLYFKRVKKLFDQFGINILRELEQYNGIDNNNEISELTNKLTGVKKQLLEELETKSKRNTSDLTS